jgi:ABC-type transport system involved in Fe-S cluster assembly fused permease/ATPase subunit
MALFNDAIKYNIGYGKPGMATKEDVDWDAVFPRDICR